MTEPYRLTASQALALMQKGELTVEDYAKSLLARIKARDDVVKAWAFLNPELVLTQARKLDQIPAEKRGPLHGVAIGVKDVILTKGTGRSFPPFSSSSSDHGKLSDMPTCHNSPIYKDDGPTLVDAAPIITLRAAGALIFGKTTTTEFASTSDGGPSTNPHDSGRTPGGSSSGSGAAVGDFQVLRSVLILPNMRLTSAGAYRTWDSNRRKHHSTRLLQWDLRPKGIHPPPFNRLSLTSTIANMGRHLSRGPNPVLHDLRHPRPLRTLSRRPRPPLQGLPARR
jgi:hypothetical protein